jgi:hypothetical protein
MYRMVKDAIMEQRAAKSEKVSTQSGSTATV